MSMFDPSKPIDIKSIDLDAMVAAANAGDVTALFVGSYVLEGGFDLGVTTDNKISCDWILQGAKMRDPLCLARYGLMRYYGWGVVQNNKEAFPYLRDSRKWIMEQAEQRHPFAECFMGLMYFKGVGLPLKHAEAVRWLERASEQGVAQAQHYLAECYEFGSGVKKDDAEREKWYLRAAEQGYAHSQTDLGFYYEQNKNWDRALHWWNKAAAQGYVSAQHYLGRWYGRKDKDAPPDFEKSYAWYKKGADAGFIESILKVAGLLSSGTGVPQNCAEAYSLYLGLLERKGITLDTTPMLLGDRAIVEKNIRQLLASAQRIISEDGEPGWEFADGTMVWELKKQSAADRPMQKVRQPLYRRNSR